jgi:CheY-like chemotaxis protein
LAAAEHVENLGYEVCGSAADEDEAVRLAGSTRPDLILMDVRPARRRRRDQGHRGDRATLPAVPVVFCTAYAGDPATRGRMAAVGAAAILAKPILPEQLGPLLGRLLGSA